MDQMGNNIISTKEQSTKEENIEPGITAANEKTNVIFATVEQGMEVYTDQTGRFPVTSSQDPKTYL